MKRVWVVCRIDTKAYIYIQNNLYRGGHTDIKVYVPTVSILKKVSKGKSIYEDVPMLFSYGFLKMPVEKAYSRTFLASLRANIPGIHSWVKSLDYNVRKIRKRVDNAEDWDDFSVVSTVSRKDIEKFRWVQKSNKVFTNQEIAKLRIGEYVILRGYPYEGLEAQILEVIPSSKTVVVTMLGKSMSMVVTVPYDNVIYSIYHDYDAEKLHYAHNEDDNVDSTLKTAETWGE